MEYEIYIDVAAVTGFAMDLLALFLTDVCRGSFAVRNGGGDPAVFAVAGLSFVYSVHTSARKSMYGVSGISGKGYIQFRKGLWNHVSCGIFCRRDHAVAVSDRIRGQIPHGGNAAYGAAGTFGGGAASAFSQNGAVQGSGSTGVRRPVGAIKCIL